MNLKKEKLADGTKDPRRKKWMKQRTKRGYSDRDVWSFDSFLAPVIAGGVRKIAEFDGHPSDIGEEEWRAVLNFIADQFEWYAENQFSFNSKFDNQMSDPESDWHKAWALLQENFGGLWT